MNSEQWLTPEDIAAATFGGVDRTLRRLHAFSIYTESDRRDAAAMCEFHRLGRPFGSWSKAFVAVADFSSENIA